MINLWSSWLASLLLVGNALASCDLSGSAWTSSFWQDAIRGSSVVVCDKSVRGNGKCDAANNMDYDSCGYDGGDCCLTSCYANCVSLQEIPVVGADSDIPYSFPTGALEDCLYMCGVAASPKTNCPYQCVSDSYVGMGSNFTQWCNHDRGQAVGMSSCISTQEDVVNMLIDCLMDETSHGSTVTANARCGNQTMDCTLSDVVGKIDGCHLHPDVCTNGACCSTAFAKGWIDTSSRELPGKCAVHDTCASDSNCFATMAQCGRTNKSCKGGCCKCTPQEWFGFNCDRPLCWPTCVNGACVAPNMCHCNANWSGPSCETPVCNPNCVPGQGVCVGPNTCECFYGFEGAQCENPKSNPPCVNGVAIGPDLCQCDSGWGGRICDYPLCQGYPTPSSDCGHGICNSPWECKCEPGWSLTVPVGLDGIDVLPTYWKGRDVSTNIAPTSFVYGDTRFLQVDNKTYYFDQYNAYKCTTPSCRVVIDPHCSGCGENIVSGLAVCTECDAGFYLSAVPSSPPCLRCSITFPHCRICSAAACVVCDPLFSMVNGKCVSDGLVEFSSPFYHAFSNEASVTLTVIRTVDSIDLDWSKRDYAAQFGITFTAVTVPSEDPAEQAVFASQDEFSDYDLVSVTVNFSSASVTPANPSTRSDLRSVYTLAANISVPIFDNLRFDSTLKSFQVKLIPDPEMIPGIPSPLRPLPGLDTYNAYDYTVDEATVYVWDANSFDYSTCAVDASFFASSSAYTVGPSFFTIPVTCSKCSSQQDPSGCVSWTPISSTDNVTFITTTMTSLPSLVTSTTSGTFDGSGNLLVKASLPSVAATSFNTTIQVAYPGVIANQFIWTSVLSATNIPNMRRLQATINSEWNQGQFGPALVQFDGYLHFGCITGTSQLPLALGFALSQGSSVSLSMSGTQVLSTQRDIYDATATGAAWQAPSDFTTSGCTPNVPYGLVCYYRRDSQSTIIPYAGTEIIPISIAFTPSTLFPRNPSGIRFVMLNSDGVTTSWKVVPSTCLYGGVEIVDSPARFLETAASR